MPMSPTHHNARRLRDGLETQKTIKIDPNDPRILYYREFFSNLAKKHKEVIFLDIYPSVCDDAGNCLVEIDGAPVYHDNNHINYTASRKILDLLPPEQLAPFTQKK